MILAIINRRFFFAMLGCFFITHLFSQEELSTLLIGKRTLADIMSVVDQYFAAHPEESIINEEEGEFENEHLKWKRWEWYMSNHLGPKGEFVDISELLWQGVIDKDKMTKPQERNINSSWSFIGPSSSFLHKPGANFNGIGRVDRICFHPTDPDIIYLGSPAGGLWRTTNGGTAWTSLSDNIPSLGISGIVVSYADPTHIYVLTGDGDSDVSGLQEDIGYVRRSIGVLESTDNGSTWHRTGTFPNLTSSTTGYQLIQNPDNPDILLAATSIGIYRTTDAGVTWVREVIGRFWDVEYKPGDGTRVYATSQGQFWLSTDSGNNWTNTSTFDIHPSTCGNGRIQIAVAPTSIAKVYLFAGPLVDTGQFCGLYLSTNSGLSFTRQSNTPNIFGSAEDGMDANSQSSYNNGIACRTDLSTTIVTGGMTSWKSTNGGVSWVKLTSYRESGSFPYIHPDMHDVRYNPLNHWLYIASDGGFYRSQDHGSTWTDLSPNIETSQFYHMSGWNGNINKLLGGLQDNGLKYRFNNTAAWGHMNGGDGFAIEFDPVSGEPLYGTINTVVAKYWDDGMDGEGITPPGSEDDWFKTLAVHNTDPDILLVGSADIYKSVSAGATYTNEGASGSWGLISCPSNNNRFYAIGGESFVNGEGNLYISDNAGSSWTAKTGNPDFPDQDDWVKISDVAVRPNNSTNVWACFAGFSDGIKVVKSTNAGDTWTNVSGSLPNVPMLSLAIDQDNGAYVGSDIGVFYRGPSMTDWMPWSNGMPNTLVTDLVIFDNGTTRKIRASTFGRGVWEANLAEACDNIVIVLGSQKGLKHFESSGTISSSADITGGSGTFVSFKATNYVSLTEGFDVTTESEFKAYTGPCGQGGVPSITGGAEEEKTRSATIIQIKRLYDPEAELPYGSIKSLNANEGQISVKLNLLKEGQVELFATREIQETLTSFVSEKLSGGDHDFTFDISSLPKEFHYLLFFYEGKLAHFQELDLRM